MERFGAEVYAQLKQAQESLRQESLSLRKDWQAIDRHLNELVSRRAAAIVELAQLYLPTLSAESVQSSLAEVRTELQLILDRQQRQIAELTGRKHRLEEDQKAVGSQIHELDSGLRDIALRQESLSADVAAQLADHEEFQRISARVLETEGELKKLEQRGRELKEEADRKLPPYRSSSLFQYLLSREYGTENYQSRGWTRRLDRWVARLINYTSAMRSYDFLTRAPELFSREIERRRKEFQFQMEQMETIEERISEQVGLTAVLSERRQVEEHRSQLQVKLEQVGKMIREVEQQLLVLGREGGPFYQEALSRLRQFLDRTRTSVLQLRASQTPTPIDDEIVSRIAALNRDIEITRPKIERLDADCRSAESQLEGMEFILRRFSQSNFDATRSRFRQEFNLAELVRQYQGGVLTRDAFWEKIRDDQRFEPTPLEQQASEIAMHPMTGVLLEAMLRTAGSMAGDQVHRSILRRSTGSTGSGIPEVFSPPAMQLPRWERSSHSPPPPVPQPVHSPPPTAPPPVSKPHGYSSGAGF